MGPDRLDPTRPYAEIFGDDEGRRFEQDGRYYRNNGRRWQPPVVLPKKMPRVIILPFKGRRR